MQIYFLLILVTIIVFATVVKSITLNACCAVGSVYINHECVGKEVVEDEDDYNPDLLNVTFKGYSFHNYLPDCVEDEVMVTIGSAELLSQDESDYDYINLPAITDSGYLRFEEAYYAPREFCILSMPSVNDDNFTIRVCKPTCNERVTCIPKCCLLNEVLEIHPSSVKGQAPIQSCVPVKSGKIWKPTVYDELDTKLGTGNSNYPVNIRLDGIGEWNMSECHTLALYPYKGKYRFDFRLMTNGDIMYRSRSKRFQKMRGRFCMDGLMENGMFSGYENDTIVLNCFPFDDVSAGADYTLGKWYYSLMIISAFFLLVTIIIYLLLWEKHTIHGFSLLSYFVALLLMQLGFVSVFILSEQSVWEGSNARMSNSCLVAAVFTHFAFVHAFTWMTIVNFDLWCTFRTLKSSLTTSRGVKRYLKYVAFALGVPIIIVTVGLVLDFRYGDDMPYERALILPDYAKRKCYVSNPDARLPYIIGPITAFLLVNIFFFVSTVCALREANEGSKLARSNTPSRRQSYVLVDDEKEFDASEKRSLVPLKFIISGHFRVTLIVKLICIMGVPWVFEVISSAEMWSTTQDFGSNAVAWYWMILDFVNHSQGVIIFIFFVCKQDIINSLRSKFPCVNQICQYLSHYLPCCSARACGSRNATVLTIDSDNEAGRPYALNSRNKRVMNHERARGSLASQNSGRGIEQTRVETFLIDENVNKQ